MLYLSIKSAIGKPNQIPTTAVEEKKPKPDIASIVTNPNIIDISIDMIADIIKAIKKFTFGKPLSPL